VSATWLGASIGANVALLIGLIGLIFLSYAGVFPPGSAAKRPSANALTSGQARSSPTATATLAPSPTVSAGWLRIAPGSVQLGCDGDQNTQYVILENTGPEPVEWQAVFSLPDALVGVAVNPQQGQLDTGASTPIQLQNNTQAGGPQGVPSQQGVIQFAPTTLAAGPPASLAYTATGC
jgi:hypothetical protein